MNPNQKIIKNFAFYSFLICVTFLAITEMDKSSVEAIDPICIEYHRLDKIITLSCDEIRLSDIEKKIRSSVLSQESVKEWLLKADLVINKKGTLIIDPYDTKTLKIVSPYGIKSYGNLIIDSVKITSWDSKLRDYAVTDGIKPRAYITQESKATGIMDITNSELAYLGYDQTHKRGISYYAGDESVFNNNNVHDMWYGIYSKHVDSLRIENNTIHDNKKYGIYAHTDSRDFTIRNNTIYNISDGIGIGSSNGENILIEKNKVSTSKKGIVLKSNTNNSIVKDNVSFNQTLGISISDSSNNSILNNTVFNVDYGIELEVKDPDEGITQNNKIILNTITNITKVPIFINELSALNSILQNTFDVSKEAAVIIDPLAGFGNQVLNNYFISEPKIISEPEIIEAPKIEEKNEPEKDILKVDKVANLKNQDETEGEVVESFTSEDEQNANNNLVESKKTESDFSVEEIMVKSIFYEKSTIIEFTNEGKEDVNSISIWLGSDYTFESFKTEMGWLGEKTPQGVIIFTSSEPIKPGESAKFGVKTNESNPGINWKALDKKGEQMGVGKSIASDFSYNHQ
jgi:parallel beta-helix repeat protein